MSQHLIRIFGAAFLIWAQREPEVFWWMLFKVWMQFLQFTARDSNFMVHIWVTYTYRCGRISEAVNVQWEAGFAFHLADLLGKRGTDCLILVLMGCAANKFSTSGFHFGNGSTIWVTIGNQILSAKKWKKWGFEWHESYLVKNLIKTYSLTNSSISQE